LFGFILVELNSTEFMLFYNIWEVLPFTYIAAFHSISFDAEAYF